MRERRYYNNDSQRRGKKERRGGNSRESKYGLQCFYLAVVKRNGLACLNAEKNTLDTSAMVFNV